MGKTDGFLLHPTSAVHKMHQEDGYNSLPTTAHLSCHALLLLQTPAAQEVLKQYNVIDLHLSFLSAFGVLSAVGKKCWASRCRQYLRVLQPS